MLFPERFGEGIDVLLVIIAFENAGELLAKRFEKMIHLLGELLSLPGRKTQEPGPVRILEIMYIEFIIRDLASLFNLLQYLSDRGGSAGACQP